MTPLHQLRMDRDPACCSCGGWAYDPNGEGTAARQFVNHKTRVRRQERLTRRRFEAPRAIAPGSLDQRLAALSRRLGGPQPRPRLSVDAKVRSWGPCKQQRSLFPITPEAGGRDA
jgi:hypothetical protein